MCALATASAFAATTAPRTFYWTIYNDTTAAISDITVTHFSSTMEVHKIASLAPLQVVTFQGETSADAPDYWIYQATVNGVGQTLNSNMPYPANDFVCSLTGSYVDNSIGISIFNNATISQSGNLGVFRNNQPSCPGIIGASF